MWSKFVALAALVACAQGYFSGAAVRVCDDMIPEHPVPPQTSPAPYTLTPNTKIVKAGTPMKVVVSGKSTSDTIGRLMLQARHGDTPVGTFTISHADNFSKLLNCTPGNAVTHKEHETKDEKQTLAYTWTPPKEWCGDIKFRATVAKNGAVFWVGITSAPVQVVLN